MGINRGLMYGILLEGGALFIMVILALLDIPIPDILSYIFVLGLIMVMVGSVITIAKGSKKNLNKKE